MWSERTRSRPERRRFVHLALALFLLAMMSAAAAMERPAGAASAQEPDVPALSYPIGDPGRPFGDGFMIRHGFATENTWYLPGYLHAGEDWYRVDGETAGATVSSMGDGQVVYAGFDYPGRVVVIQHQEDLYSMYGHLDPDLAVDRGDLVERGERIGVVGARADGVPNHLHFEVRTFLTTSDVNGDAPRYGFACGVECPPGPGYWPIEAPDNPVDVGWRNPSHAIAAATDGVQGLEAVVAAEPTVSELQVRSQPGEDAELLATTRVELGQRFPLVDVRAGQVDSDGTSAEAYSVWYRIQLDQAVSGWVRAIVPSTRDTGSDGRASSLRFVLLPAVADSARQVGREGLANTTI